ncbi:MAG: enolase C-terminal domain-like protein [Anaerolineae bacterium]
MRKTDITVKEAELHLVEMPPARATLKFGAATRSSDKPARPQRAFLPHVRVRVENGAGQSAVGWGAIGIGVAWSWPKSEAGEQIRSDAMRQLMQEFCQEATRSNPSGHPLDIFHDLEAELPALSRKACAAVGLAEDMPYLASLISLCPLDAAIHDAFGVVNGIDTYDGYGPDHMSDLSRYLGPQFKGKYLSQYLQPAYKPWIPVFHLVGGADKLLRSEVDESDPQDGLPNSLDEWIEHDRLICLKVKLCGTDLAWDLERTLAVEAVARETQERLGIRELHLTTDMNEQAESPEYVVEFLHKLRERRPSAFEALLYVEQPTERDLNLHRFDMSPIAAMKPVIVDESLMTTADFDLAMELGWTGVALKTCKCQSHALLCAAKAEDRGVPYMVQDLTNPGLALIHSVGLAARLDTMMGVEANSRQFRPAWSEPEAAVHPHTLWPVEGRVSTETFGKLGLGYRIEEIDRPVFRGE